ncbi:MAG: hypothetical protein PVF29_10360 [Desulfobacterales bacterium]
MSNPCCNHCLTPFSVRYVMSANSVTEKDFRTFGDRVVAGFLGAAAALFFGAVAFFAEAAALFFGAAVFFAEATAFFFGAAVFFAGALAFWGRAVTFFALAAPFFFGFLEGFFCSFFAIVD